MDASQLEQNRADGSNMYTCRRYTIMRRKKDFGRRKNFVGFFIKGSSSSVFTHLVSSIWLQMMAKSLVYKPNTMHFHVIQLEMIEGDKTTAATLFSTNIFFSPRHLVICLHDNTTTINGNKKRSNEDGHLHCHAAFFLFY